MYKVWRDLISAMVIFSIFIMAGCERSSLENAEIRAEIDTLVNREVKIIQSELDSVCHTNMALWEKHYVDSILPIRKRQILGKLKAANEQ